MAKISLPEDLEQEILLRLPSKSLKRFSLVCKRWHSYLQNPLFIKRYHSFPSRRQALLCFRRDYATKTNVVSLHDQQTFEKIEDLEFPPFPNDGLEREGDEKVFDKYLKNYEFHRDIHVLGPINGFYCIYHRLIERWGGTLVLWNPESRAYKHIRPAISFPFPSRHLRVPWNRNVYDNDDDDDEDPWYLHDDDESSPEGFEIGFGFDHNLMDYKVVVICYWCRVYDFYIFPYLWDIRVYNSATDSWRIFDRYYTYTCKEASPIFGDLILDSRPGFTNCYLNQACHWSCRKELVPGLHPEKVKSHVLAFDMVEETFKILAGPPILPIEYVRRSVWVCQEALVMVACSARTKSIEVWKMNEYGVAESWTMQYSISRVGPINGFRVVGFSNDGRVFFGDNNAQLVSYSPDDDYKKIKAHGIYGTYEVVGDHNIIDRGIDETLYNFIDNVQFVYGETLGVVNFVESLGPVKPLVGVMNYQQSLVRSSSNSNSNNNNNNRGRNNNINNHGTPANQPWTGWGTIPPGQCTTGPWVSIHNNVSPSSWVPINPMHNNVGPSSWVPINPMHNNVGPSSWVPINPMHNNVGPSSWVPINPMPNNVGPSSWVPMPNNVGPSSWVPMPNNVGPSSWVPMPNNVGPSSWVPMHNYVGPRSWVPMHNVDPYLQPWLLGPPYAGSAPHGWPHGQLAHPHALPHGFDSSRPPSESSGWWTNR